MNALKNRKFAAKLLSSFITLMIFVWAAPHSSFAGGMVLTKQAQEANRQLKLSRLESISQPENFSSLRVLYFGGPVISHVKVVTVFWGKGVDAETVAGISKYYRAVTNSTYLDWLDKEYNTHRKSDDGKVQGTNQSIGRGAVASEVTITPFNSAVKLDKSDVEIELGKQIDAGKLPVPDADTLYMIHYPAGITLLSGGQASCQAWCGDHEGFTHPHYGYIYYAMLPDIGGACSVGCGFAQNSFDSLTVIASHELVESITDPMCPNIGQSGAFPAAWLAADQNEVGDLCAGPEAGSGQLVTSSRTYALQSEWENSTSSCKGGTFSP